MRSTRRRVRQILAALRGRAQWLLNPRRAELLEWVHESAIGRDNRLHPVPSLVTVQYVTAGSDAYTEQSLASYRAAWGEEEAA